MNANQIKAVELIRKLRRRNPTGELIVALAAELDAERGQSPATVSYNDLKSCLAVAGNGNAYSRNDLCVAVNRLASEVERLTALVDAALRFGVNSGWDLSRQHSHQNYAQGHDVDAVVAAWKGGGK